MTTIGVTVVLHNSSADIAACLSALLTQRRQPDAVVVVDNASEDSGQEVARQAVPDAIVVREERNIGFAAAHNKAMAIAPMDLHLVLNPDCQLAPDFLERAVGALEADPAAGSLTGRLLRFRSDAAHQPTIELADDRLDSTGMIALRNRRVLDRGGGEPARDRYLDHQYVLGASGAAAVYRRAMLEDTAVSGQYFDESFFAYREDVDLAWRAQLRGWRCRYLPTALARHRRYVAPGRRRRLPARINRLSVGNRWRMIAKNETREGWRADWAAILTRDLLTVGYCLLLEQRTLLALRDVLVDRGALRTWRREIVARRTVAPADVLRWFGRVSAEPAAPFG